MIIIAILVVRFASSNISVYQPGEMRKNVDNVTYKVKFPMDSSNLSLFVLIYSALFKKYLEGKYPVKNACYHTYIKSLYFEYKWKTTLFVVSSLISTRWPPTWWQAFCALFQFILCDMKVKLVTRVTAADNANKCKQFK